MGTVNCRNEKICVFCKNWLGVEADTNFVTGETKLGVSTGLCSKDGQKHKQSDLCKNFRKNIVYL